MLYLVCTVCNQPRPVHPDSEWYLLNAETIYCTTCGQGSRITEEIKNDIRKREIK